MQLTRRAETDAVDRASCGSRLAFFFAGLIVRFRGAGWGNTKRRKPRGRTREPTETRRPKMVLLLFRHPYDSL